jgi:TetR/AcrR family transcriptional repressor of nem operon
MPQTMKDKILDAAEKRVRGAGFSAMSFRDLASDVGIKSASVHYHFPTKPDLGEALVDRYTSQFKEHLERRWTATLRFTLRRWSWTKPSVFARSWAQKRSGCPRM